MRTAIAALQLLFVFVAACGARNPSDRQRADTARRTSVAGGPDVPTPPPSAPREPVVDPPSIVRPADTVLRTDSTGALHMPVIFPHACQGEDCADTFPAVACRGLQLRVAPADSSAVTAVLMRGDSVEITRRDLHVLRAGRVIVRRAVTIDSDITEGPDGDEKIPRADTVHFAPGDTVYLLAYSGMGSWQWWHGGKSETTGQFFAVPDDDWLGIPVPIGAESRAIALSKPQTADWWLVTPRVGGTGWWRNDGSWSLRPSSPSFDVPRCPTPDSATVR